MASKELGLRPADFFQLIAAQYDTPSHERFYQQVASELIAKLPPTLTMGSVLEAGAGTGFATTLLKDRFPETRIVALEPSPEMLARGAGKTDGVEWINRTVSDMWGSFDLIVSFMSFQWLDRTERQKIIELAESGTLALALPVTGGPLLNGNKALRKLIRELGGVRGWAPQVRRPGAIAACLQSHFRHVNCYDLNIREQFQSTEDLAHVLHVRGVLYAFFEERAAAARDMLAYGGEGPADFNWSLRLFVATNNSSNL